MAFHPVPQVTVYLSPVFAGRNANETVPQLTIDSVTRAISRCQFYTDGRGRAALKCWPHSTGGRDSSKATTEAGARQALQDRTALAIPDRMMAPSTTSAAVAPPDAVLSTLAVLGRFATNAVHGAPSASTVKPSDCGQKNLPLAAATVVAARERNSAGLSAEERGVFVATVVARRATALEAGATDVGGLGLAAKRFLESRRKSETRSAATSRANTVLPTMGSTAVETLRDLFLAGGKLQIGDQLSGRVSCSLHLVHSTDVLTTGVVAVSSDGGRWVAVEATCRERAPLEGGSNGVENVVVGCGNSPSDAAAAVRHAGKALPATVWAPLLLLLPATAAAVDGEQRPPAATTTTGTTEDAKAAAFIRAALLTAFSS